MSIDPEIVMTAVIPGEPRGQGSLHLTTNANGREQARYSTPVVNHRNLVISVFQREWNGQRALTCPIAVKCRFVFPRPAAHYLPVNTKRTVPELRADAPEWHLVRRDLDKLVRLILDAGTIAGLYADDGQVSLIRAEKVWGDAGTSEVEIWAM